MWMSNVETDPICIMINLKRYIQGKVVFLGVGNPLKGDDGVGCFFVKELKNSGEASPSQIHIFDGGLVPENYLEPIVKIDPDSVFIVDAIDFDGFPGEIRLFHRTSSQLYFSTHTLPLTFILEYLSKRTEAQIFILGIQPEKLSWGTGLSPKVKNAVRELVRELSF